MTFTEQQKLPPLTNRLIAPLFLLEGNGIERDITSIPGQCYRSVDMLAKYLEGMGQLGLKEFVLFPIPHDKAADEAFAALDPLTSTAVELIKREFPQFNIICDTCVCQMLKHGHCRLMTNEYIDEDKTLSALASLATTYAQAGADSIMPSAMCDGQVAAIRHSLNKAGFEEVKITAQSAKFASSLYGPFRDSAHSGGRNLSKSSYQLDPANAHEALRELNSDLAEGANSVMVKPGLINLDIIRRFRDQNEADLIAFMTSGECNLLRSSDSEQLALIRAKEAVHSLIRAGSSKIITYWAEQIARSESERHV